MSIEKDFELALKTAKLAGESIMKFFNKPIEIFEKSPNNPVTEADFLADKLIHSKLLENSPNYGWLSEESVDDGSRFQREKVWVVDPIDGTRAFIKGLPHFSVSIALIENAIPILGIIHNPATNETFWAIKNGGAYKNGIKILASSTEKLIGAKMLGDTHMFSSKSWPMPWPDMEITQRNSIAYRMALVASGEFDGAIATTPKNDWDVAAGTLIAHEAGAFATDHKGEPHLFNQKRPLQRSLITCNKYIYSDILARMGHIQ